MCKPCQKPCQLYIKGRWHSLLQQTSERVWQKRLRWRAHFANALPLVNIVLAQFGARKVKVQIMKKQKLNQTDRVLAYLDAHGSISTREAITFLNIKNLSNVISQLRVLGYEFEIVEKQYGNPAATRWSLKEKSADHVKETVENTSPKVATNKVELDFSKLFKKRNVEDAKRFDMFKSAGDEESAGDENVIVIDKYHADWIAEKAAKKGISPAAQLKKILCKAWAEEHPPIKSEIDLKIERIRQDAFEAGLALNVRDCGSTQRQIDIVSSEGWGVQWFARTGTICAARIIEGQKYITGIYESKKLSENGVERCTVRDAKDIVPFIQSKIHILRSLQTMNHRL